MKEALYEKMHYLTEANAAYSQQWVGRGFMYKWAGL